jgi:Imm-5 like putative immunity protein
MNTKDLNKLESQSPCADGLKWARRYPSLADAWEACSEPYWMLWALQKFEPSSKEESVQIAVGCARLVLPIFEGRYPSDHRPRKAIEAAEAWIASPCESTKLACCAAHESASDASRSACDAACDATDADAACAVSRAAAAAAYDAAYAASDASRAATRAARGASAAIKSQIADIIRSVAGNLFKP